MELLPEAGVMDSLGPTENGLSVNMSGLKPSRVLEVYVKRSVSLREGGFTDKELKWRSLPAKIPQKITSRRNGPGLSDPGIRCRAREREQNERESKTRGDETVPPVSNSSSVEPTVEKEASKGRSKDGKKGKKSQTFFSKVASFLWRRKGDEKKDEGGKRSKESGLPPEEHPPAQNGEQPLADSQEPPEELAIAHKPKSTKKKSSLRRVFSFKKNNFEVKGFGSGSPGTSKSKAVRPSQLDLRDVCGPMHGKTDPDTECLYEQATEEVKRIVQTLESSEGCENKGGSLAEELETQGPTETDKTIWKIVAILQNVGDHVDTELQGNSLLSTFFADMSYNSFKQLADQYIEKEVRSKVTQANSDLVKFAFTLDFTAKVAGICSHQIKRITGFGSQYLQDACWQLPSFSDQQETENNTEKIPSPD
ncbi:apoptosis facilitator Bcl-2-like protein 14 isoform X2 [Heptranchias perlo]|uniref:apoptosis facilitator Bcl-2-like protein 14 isoform X2 n=1 Tax=Heptranchias perlo TaxID=212740 RepID=UPI00355A2616